jgi:Carbohydrate binding module (family 6)
MRLIRHVCALQARIVFFSLLGSMLAARPAPAATLTVCAAGCTYTDFQQALDDAQSGDTILLRAGETFIGNFVLPVKSGTAPILVRSDASDGVLPSPDTRLIPFGYPDGNTDRSVLARLRGVGGIWKTTPVLQAAQGAHDYRLQFLDIDGVAQEGWETLLELGNNSDDQTTLGAVPYSIVLDRMFVHGHPTKGQKRCISLNGRYLDVLNSYVTSCASFALEAQAIAGFNGPGPIRIVNNYLEATTENVMFGGADPKIPGLVPSDIEIRRNSFAKQPAWRNPILEPPSAPSTQVVAGAGGLGPSSYYFTVVALVESEGDIGLSAQSPAAAVWVGSSSAAVNLSWSAVDGADRYRVYCGSYPGGQDRYIETTDSTTSVTYRGWNEQWSTPPSSGTRWNVKNLLELKNAQRVTIDGNIFEHVWAANQTGYAILFTPRNTDGGAPWTVVRDVTFSNNILRHAAAGVSILGEDDIRGSQRTSGITIRNNLVYDLSSGWGGSSHFVLMTRSPIGVKIDHNSVFHDGMVTIVDDGLVWGFEFTNNVAPHNDYGIFGSGAGSGYGAISAYFPDGVVVRNALGGGPASLYPPDNFFPDIGTFWAQFVNPAASDYGLVSGSLFAGRGTDGKNLGVDFDALNAAQQPAAVGHQPVSGSSPYGRSPIGLPGIIEAENFDDGGSGTAYWDTTGGNSGGAYRNTDVDVEPTSDAGGGYDVGWMFAGEWLKYTVNVGASGRYSIAVRVASDGGGGTFHIEADGVDITGSIGIPNTGGWQTWTTVTRMGVALNAGSQVWRVVMDSNGATGAVGNINFIRVTSGSSGGSTPFGGWPAVVPGLIQVERFDEGGSGVAYADTTAGNSGGGYRNSDVDIEETSDGDYDVGWTIAGEWLKYTLTVDAAGTYDIQLRVACAGSGGTFHIEVDDVDVTGPLRIPDTGGWQAWTTITAPATRLTAGQQTWRIVFDTNGAAGAVGNLDWIRITAR